MDMTFFRAALLGACVLLSGCDSATTPATPASTATVLDGKTMGTFWRVSVIGVDEAKAEALRAKVQAQLDADDRLLSTWKNDSALMRFNHAADTRPWPVSEAMADIVTLSLRIGAKTHGAMDITVGPLVNLWGFGPDKQPVTTPDAQAIAAAKARTGLQHLQVINQSGRQFLQKDIPDLFVDLSTVGEGYAADHLARLMEQEGISRYLVSVGGALVSRGMTAKASPGGWRSRNRPTGKTPSRRLSTSMVTASAPPAAIVITMNSTANVSRTSSIRRPGSR